MNLCDMAKRTGLTRQRILQAAQRKGLGQYEQGPHKRRWSFSEADYEIIKEAHDKWVAQVSEVKREQDSD